MADFDDGKESGALRTIGEVGQALGIKPHVLRYWEQQFPMLEPLKRSGGRRYYRAEDVALVERTQNRGLGALERIAFAVDQPVDCLLYTSPSPRDATLSRMPSSA